MEKIIYYLGDDEIFQKALNTYFSRDPSESYKIICLSLKESNWQKNLLDILPLTLPHAIIVDFVDSKGFLNEMSELLLLLKGHEEIKKVPYFGLFGSKEEFTNLKSVLTCGILYGHIKGTEEYEIFFLDLIYVAFNESVVFPEYAKADKINLPYYVGVSANLTHFNAIEMMVETDVDDFDGGQVNMLFNFFPEFNKSSFKLSGTLHKGLLYEFTNTISLKIPYPSPWEEVLPSTLQRDSVETWIDHNKSEFKSVGGSILLISENMSLIPSLASFSLKSDALFSYQAHFDEQFSKVDGMRPFLILIELAELKDEEDKEKTELFNTQQILKNNVSMLEQLVWKIKALKGYEPIILVFNSPSTSVAYQKAFEYKSILAMGKAMEKESIEYILKSTSAKLPQIHQGQSTRFHTFNKSDLRRVCEVKLDVLITSLTEHELTFCCHAEIPMFSVVKLDMPGDGYYLIVPPTRDLPSGQHGHHYMGFIHSVSDKELMMIRKFVNQMIFSPPREFKYYKEEPSPDVAKSSKVKKVQEEKVQKSIPRRQQSSGRFVVKRDNIKGKSKLG